MRRGPQNVPFRLACQCPFEAVSPAPRLSERPGEQRVGGVLGQRSPLGLDRAGHPERALAGFQAVGCSADLCRVQALAGLTTT